MFTVNHIMQQKIDGYSIWHTVSVLINAYRLLLRKITCSYINSSFVLSLNDVYTVYFHILTMNVSLSMYAVCYLVSVYLYILL